MGLSSSVINYYSDYEKQQARELEKFCAGRTQTAQTVKALVGGEEAYAKLPQITILSQYIQNRPRANSDLPIFYARNISFPVMQGTDPEKKREFLVIKRTGQEGRRKWEEVLTIAQRAEDSEDEAWYLGQSKRESYSQSPYQELGYTFLNQRGAQKVSEDVHDRDTEEYFNIKELLENKSLTVIDKYGDRVTYSIHFPEKTGEREFTLDQMPLEILTRIFGNCLTEMAKLREVSSLFRDIIDARDDLQTPKLKALWKPHTALQKLLGPHYASLPHLGEFENIPLNPHTYFPVMQGTDTARKRTFYVLTVQDSYTTNNRSESYYEKKVFFRNSDNNIYYASSNMFGTGTIIGTLILSQKIQEKLGKGVSDEETKPYEDLKQLIDNKQLVLGDDRTLTLEDTYTIEH